MAFLKFLKGNYESLGNAAIAEGQILVTKDTRELFVDVDGSTRIKIGDFTVVSNLAALEALDATKVPTSRLYYVEEGNILARSNGTTWVQVNKQKTAEELKTFLGLGSMAFLSEVSEDNLAAALKEKVNAASEGNHSHNNKALLDTYTQTEADLADAVAKKHEHANAAELAKIVDGDKAKWDAVAADHLTADDKATLENAIKEAKKAGTDANTALESYKVTNDAAIDAIEEDIAEIVDGTNGILAQAKAYSDGKLATARTEISAEIDADVKAVNDAFEGYKTSNDAALAGVKATADAAAVKADVDAALADRYTKAEADGKFALIADAYDDTELAGRVSAAEGKIAGLETESAKHALKTEVEAVDAKFADYKTAEAQKAIDDAQDERIKAIEDTYLVADDIADFETKENVKKVADDLAAYVEANDEALAGVKATAEAATTVEEVDTQIDAKIGALKLAETYEPIGAEGRAKAYADGLITDANLGQYTTEQEVKDIVDTVVAGAVDGDTITGLANLVEYINTHGGEAAEMAAAIDVLEGDVKGLKEAPAAGIKATDIAAWNGEIGAKALAETKTTEAEVKAQIEAYGYATTGYADGKAADAQAAAEATAAGALATARTEITAEIDADVKALADGQVKTNTEAIAANAAAITSGDEATLASAKTYTDGLLEWGSF